uniref:WW domain-containing protein n=2 Tax=Lotharella oceanica TaxID=641309 RepID=A0A7S2TTU5_9EUKA|mmetsp:Transcript_27936/g.52168  ORF Transcript_27936/g.52168 Transcript_27936/m.52168 type:complete len:232 (+) Transcript_27936:197-892(+)
MLYCCASSVSGHCSGCRLLLTFCSLSWRVYTSCKDDNCSLEMCGITDWVCSSVFRSFSVILFTWELKFACCNTCFAKNMGFMYSWTGRLMFFVFVGTLSFGIAYPAGLVIGIWTFVNMTWNMFVIFYHPTYFSTLKNKAESEFRDAMLKEASRRAGADIKALDAGIPKKQWDEEQKIREAQEEIIAGIPEASGQAEISQEDGNWVMRTDDQSGTAYWVNQVTGEQSWERPS